MMNNLFSIFDPSTFTFNFTPWMAMLIPLMMLMNMKMKFMSKWNMMLKAIISPLSKELKSLKNPHNQKGVTNLMLAVFMTIFMINFTALSPFIFTPTAHMMIALPMALTIWMGIMLFGWINSTKNMLAHTVPSGTPDALMNFMVLIELTSNIIRPITLSIRLSANMVAGHLLLSLLSNFSLSSMNNLTLSSPILLILSILEMAVAMIQAYVFMTLLTLYTTEIH